MVACVAGWNATTAAYVTAASFFTLYHIPETNIPALTWSGRLGTDLYLSLPFLIVLVAWITVGLRRAHRRRNARSEPPDGTEAIDEA